MSVYTFITNAFRFAEAADPAVRETYALARMVEIEGRFTNLNNAAVMAQTMLGILKAPRYRFDVQVLGTNVVTPSMFELDPPCAVLTSDRFGLSAGRLVVIPDFVIDAGQGVTLLRCWG